MFQSLETHGCLQTFVKYAREKRRHENDRLADGGQLNPSFEQIHSVHDAPGKFQIVPPIQTLSASLARVGLG
jgi:hypothetical protein